MLQSKIDRLGSVRNDLLRNHLLTPLLNSMNVRVTTDEKSSLSDPINKAPFQVVTVVDPAIVSAARGDPLSSLLWRRQNLSSRCNSGFNESIFLRTPKPSSSFTVRRTHTGKRVLPPTSKRNYRGDLTSLKARLKRLKSLLSKEDSDAVDKETSTKKTKKEGETVLSPSLMKKVSPAAADAMSRTVAVEGGVAQKLALLKQREKELMNKIHLTKKAKKKKKKKDDAPHKFKANLRDFKQRIDIEGTGYVMEMYLAPDVIENARKNNIDSIKQPKISVHFTKASDMRDEFSNYCGQRKMLKNWLYYV